MARKIAQNGALTPRMAGTLRSDSQNVEQVNSNRGKNKFDLGYSNYMSLRFGEVRPFYYQQCIAEDILTHSNSSNLWTMQLKSPLLSNLVGYKDYFYVPLKCILPNTYYDWKTNPVQADDVPDDVYCNLDVSKLYNSLPTLLDFCSTVNNIKNAGNSVSMCYSLVALCYYFLSSNSLFNQLGMSLNTILALNNTTGFTSYDKDSTFDSLLEYVAASTSLNALFSNEILELLHNTHSLVVINRLSKKEFNLIPANTARLSPNGLRELYHDYIRYSELYDPTTTVGIYGVSGLKPSTWTGNQYDGLVGALLLGIFNFLLKDSRLAASRGVIFDISPILAYQLVGAQFYINDQVDKVYTASDYISEMRSLISDVPNAISNTYDYNGHTREYDVFSKKTFDTLLAVLESFNGSSTAVNNSSACLAFFRNLVVPFESLRYGDYFTGSRLNPLALGADPNSYAPVTAENVKSIDMVQAMSYLNYYNDIQKLGPTAWIQENGIYGDFPSSLDPMPRFIQRSKFTVGEMQIENQSDVNTGDIISRGRSNDSGNMISLEIDESCIVIGLISFDCPRIYTNVVDRLAFVRDRFDIFNPYFQNIGDQPILRKEFNLLKDEKDTVEAWTIRNTEYKQRISVASGAFCSNSFLPSWSFTENNSDFKLDSIHIRNHDADIDRFYGSLPNFTNSGYFHFYGRFFNDTEIVRAMQDRPDIQTPKIHQ